MALDRDIENQPNNDVPKEDSSPSGSSAKTDFLLWIVPIVLTLIIAISANHWIEAKYDYDMSGFITLIFFLTIYWLVTKIVHFFFNDKPKTTPPPHPALNWPMSGPIGNLGKYAYVVTFVPTSFLSIFNPWQLIQQIRQIKGQVSIANRIAGTELETGNYQCKVKYQLPFSGEWLIYNGGNTEHTSHSWDLFTQRYAYDFVIADNKFARHDKLGIKCRDYFCYERPILSAADGEVVSVLDGIGNAPLVGFGVADFMARNFAGNHVIVKHSEGEYGFYAHLIKGSIKVKPGDKLNVGDTIGLCGHSGHSTEPHLHFHLQDKADFFTGMGLPIKFTDVLIEGELNSGIVSIERGTKVQNGTSSNSVT